MNNSQLNTLAVPPQGTKNPATLYKAANVPLRVVVRNIGPNLVLLAHDVGTLQNTPAVANTFKLFTGAEEVIVLAPQQSLFATAIGANGQVSVAASEALPIKGDS